LFYLCNKKLKFRLLQYWYDNMKPDDHLEKLKGMERTLGKLDPASDYEAMLELCMLISSHYVNACLHRLGITPVDRDLKHNKLAGEIQRRRVEKLSALGDPIDGLEKLRPRHVYGKGRDGGVAKLAMKNLAEVRKTCLSILEG